MAPYFNKTVMYLHFLDSEPLKKEEYFKLYWTWRNHKHSDLNEDQLRYWEHLPILPIAATLILTLTVFLLLVFQRNPNLVAGIVAAGLGAIALYLFLNSMNENKLSYE